ncbi:hypothetical protein [Rhizobium sp. BE258]|uniref:hypothetical protein n=1 Tax=Rhizobium sp. BE258 TaxID=2817722 RepID=UPI00285F8D8A|nr:hypothetical protein [Rhizobium sp. BE258]MDR7145208.1 hypothetical protein [Rhizobium sp. BE258]
MRKQLYDIGVTTTGALLIALTLVASSDSIAVANWITVPNSSLEVVAGSALDISAVVPRIDSGIKLGGGVAFSSEDFNINARQPARAARFFCSTLTFGKNTGGLPPVKEIPRWADAISRAGYNAVRIHMADLFLMEGRRADFGFDPEQLDRFDHLLAELRSRGIRFIFDVMGSWNGAYGDVGDNRWIEGKHDTKVGSYFPGAERDHWAKLARVLWARQNPLTHASPLQDPATLGVILVNEGEVQVISRKGISEDFREPFYNWLLARYHSDADIEHAWGSKFSLKEVSSGANTAAASDFAAFSSELQKGQVQWMKGELEKLGYRGPVTSFDTIADYRENSSRNALSFVDLHQYADSPKNGMIEPGTEFWGGDLLDGKSRFFDKLSWSRIEGKPYTVTEYGMSYPNPNRYAVAPMTAAQAAFQNWNLVCQYGTPIALNRPGRGQWQQMLVPFNVGQDPTLRAGETIAAFLYGRGDVSPSKSRVTVQLPPGVSSAPSNVFVDWEAAKLQHLVGVAVAGEGAGEQATGFNRIALPYAEKLGSISALTAKLVRQGLITSHVADDASRGIYHSSTGEIILDTKAKVETVVTKGSVGLVSEHPSSVGGSGWKIELSEGAGAVFVSDLGQDADLSKSKHSLLVVSTDSRNSGATFKDRDEKVIDRIGRFPVQIKDATVKVIAPPGDWRFFALDFSGRRTREIHFVQALDGASQATVRLAELGDDVTPYFELVRQ